MSRNEERLGLTENTPQDTLSPATITKSSILDFPSDTSIVTLPSMGKYYKSDHPLFEKSTLEISGISTPEEDILSSKTLIKKGIVYDKLISSILKDKSIRIETLLVGDKLSILVEARKISYGKDFIPTITCSQCGHQFEEIFDLDQIVYKNFDSLSQEDREKFNISISPNGLWSTIIPRLNYVVKGRFLTVADERLIMSLREAKQKHKMAKSQEIDTTASALMKMIIEEVNGERDKTILSKFVDKMPGQISKHLRQVYKMVAPDVTLLKSVTCESCSAIFEIDLPLADREFLWPSH